MTSPRRAALPLLLSLSLLAGGPRAAQAQPPEGASSPQPPPPAWLRVLVPPEVAATPGLMIWRDGAAIEPASWGAPLPVTNGNHLIEASAPGKRRWSMDVQVSGEAAELVVAVPPLALAPAQPAAPPPAPLPPSPSHAGGAKRAATYAAAGLGLASLAVGGVFLSRAYSVDHDIRARADAECDSVGNCSPGVNQLLAERGRDNALSGAGLAGGAVLLGVAVVLLLSGASGPPKAGSSASASGGLGWPGPWQATW